MLLVFFAHFFAVFGMVANMNRCCALLLNGIRRGIPFGARGPSSTSTRGARAPFWPLETCRSHASSSSLAFDSFLDQQPHRLRAAFPRGPLHDLLRAQNDLWRGLFLSFVGAFRFDPVSLLYLARPFAVSPPPAFTESFSPRPTERLGPRFLLVATHDLLMVQDSTKGVLVV